MNAVTLKARYDGRNICPEEPLDLAPGARLVVTVVSGAPEDLDREELYELGRQSLARAYGEDEPDYSDSLHKAAPPE